MMGKRNDGIVRSEMNEPLTMWNYQDASGYQSYILYPKNELHPIGIMWTSNHGCIKAQMGGKVPITVQSAGGMMCFFYVDTHMYVRTFSTTESTTP